MLDSFTSKNWRQRRQLIDALIQSGDQVLVQELLGVLKEHRGNLDLINSTLQLLQMLKAPVTPGLLQLIESPDPETRMYAALALGELGDESSIPSLIQAVGDTDENVRFHAIEALGKLRAQEAVDALIGVLWEKNFFLSFPAVVSLGEIGDPGAAQELLKLFSNSNLTEAVATALGNVGDENAAAQISAWLESESGEVETAASALAHIGRRMLATAERHPEMKPETFIPEEILAGIGPHGRRKLLRRVPNYTDLDIPPHEQKLSADLAFLLGWLLLSKKNQIHDPEERQAIFQALIKLLAFPAAQRQAAHALVKAGPESQPALVSWLDGYTQDGMEDQKETAYAATQVLGKLADAACIPTLLKAVDSGDEEWAALAAEAIQQVCERNPEGARQYFEVLFQRIGHPFAIVRQALLASIRSLREPEDLQMYIELLKGGNPNQREEAVGLLAGAGTPQALALILKALDDPAATVRKAAIEALPCFPGEESANVLRKLASHADPAVRATACRALGQCDPQFALPILHAALRDPDPWTRMYACRSLGVLGQPSSLPHLKLIMQDPAPPVRVALAEALCQIGSPEAVRMARELLANPQMDVHQVIERILACLSETRA